MNVFTCHSGLPIPLPLMESCLGELHLQYCIIYLDDIIIFSKTPEEHLHQLRLVSESQKWG